MDRIMGNIRQDIRVALRGFGSSPGFAAAAILTLGLGIGASATMFGIVDRLMYRPYPYLRDPATVHRVYWSNIHRGIQITRWDGEYKRYLDLQHWTQSFSRYAAFAKRTMAVGTGESARERPVATVSASFFDFFAAQPALGSYFSAAEDEAPRGDDVAVLSYAFWKSEFAARNVLGEPLQVGEIPATIIGVAPQGFVGAFDGPPPAVYIPITTYAGSRSGDSSYLMTYSWRWVEMMVRRKPGVDLRQAQSDATHAAIRSWQSRQLLEPGLPPADEARPKAIITSLKLATGPSPSLEARTARWAAGLAVIVLLISTFNVANLLLTRALAKQRETALRIALGAPRRRIAAQTLTESLLLATAGSVAGLFLAAWGGAAVRRVFINGPDTDPGLLTDWRTLGAVAAMTIGAGSLCGLAAALMTRRGDLADFLRSAAGQKARWPARYALLVAQASFSMLLLVGAGLFVRSYLNVKSLPMGYEADKVLLATVNLRGTQLQDSQRIILGKRLLQTARALTGVECASSAMTVPLLVTNATYLAVPGVDSVDQLGEFSYQSTTPDYFRVMGTHILSGRGIEETDRADAPRVAVVSQSMARTLWPGQDPIGKRMRIFSDSMPWTTVVGVAEDIVQTAVTAGTKYHYYLSGGQFWPQYSGTYLLMRLETDPALSLDRVRKALQAEMPGQSYVTVEPFGDLVGSQQRPWHLGTSLLVAFGALALAVAAVGLYSVLSYDVTQRKRDLIVRMALGARSSDVARLVMVQGGRLAMLGIALGATASLAASAWFQPLLFQQSAQDPVVYCTVGTILLAVALAASALPAARATRANPNAVLRSE